MQYLPTYTPLWDDLQGALPSISCGKADHLPG